MCTGRTESAGIPMISEILLGAVLVLEIGRMLVRRPVCAEHKHLIASLNRIESRLDKLCDRYDR